MLRNFVVVLTFLLSAGFCFGQNEKAESELLSVIKELKVVGLAVVVVKKGEIIYKHNFGMQDIEGNKPLNDKSIFRIASISKSFSAVTITQLIDDGKLNLDDDFSKLVGFPVKNPKHPNT